MPTPKLVIQVVTDPYHDGRLGQLRNKRERYLRSGATVWEVYPEDRLVDIFTPDGRYRTERDVLTFAGLPGLEIPLKRVFDTIEA